MYCYWCLTLEILIEVIYRKMGKQPDTHSYTGILTKPHTILMFKLIDLYKSCLGCTTRNVYFRV